MTTKPRSQQYQGLALPNKAIMPASPCKVGLGQILCNILHFYFAKNTNKLKIKALTEKLNSLYDQKQLAEFQGYTEKVKACEIKIHVVSEQLKQLEQENFALMKFIELFLSSEEVQLLDECQNDTQKLFSEWLAG